jgi:hypothetical protein
MLWRETIIDVPFCFAYVDPVSLRPGTFEATIDVRLAQARLCDWTRWRPRQCRPEWVQLFERIFVSGIFGRRWTMAAKSKSRWSAEVTKHSDALDLEKDIFESNNPYAIAKSLKHSAEASDRRKSSPYRSAMSMLTFYINRAGKNLSKSRRNTLEQAKTSLREVFHRRDAQ